MADYAIHDTTLTGISNVIRKKEGSSALIDPADYADRINLMGMLQEKTIVFWPFCDFNDGADDVPTKAVKISIPPTFSGVSEVSERQTGRNLSSVSEYSNNPWTFWGTNFVDIASVLNTLPVGAYTLSYTFEIVEAPDTSNISYGKAYIRALVNGNYVNLTSYSISDASGVSVGDKFTVSASFTITAETVGKIENVYLYCDKKESHSGTGRGTYNLVNVMLELGSTAHDYEQYDPTNYSAELGRTIYGGEVDIVNGVGTVTHGKYSVTGQETGDFLAGTNNNGNRIGIRIIGAQTPLYAGGISNIGENKACLASSAWTIGSWCIYTDNKLYFVVPNEYTTFATALQYLVNNNATFVFPLAAQPDFTFDGQEIDTMLGYNAFWSEDGDTSVAYRASGTIYQYPSGEEASF